MSTSSISNTSVAAGQISRSTSGGGPDQAQGKKSNLSNAESFPEKQADDTVKLSTSTQQLRQATLLEAQEIDTILPRTMKSILNHNKTAIAAQANVSPQAAQEMLSER